MVSGKMSMSYDFYKSDKEKSDDKWDQTIEKAGW